MKPFSTKRYKIIATSILAFVAVFVVGGTFYLHDNAYTQNQVIASMTKRLFYTFAFAADNALSANIISYQSQQATAATSSIPVLAYHGIISQPDGSTINLTEQEFKDQMLALKKAGYHSITLNQLYNFAIKHTPLPDKPVVLTFDDGRADTFYNGDPILAALGFNANLFVVTSFAAGAQQGGYYLTNKEVQMAARTGRWTIGSHSERGHIKYPIDATGTMGYFFSNNLWLPKEERTETEEEFFNRIIKDFKDSQNTLKNLVHQPINGFAFPFGDIAQNTSDKGQKSKEVINAASTVYTMLFFQHAPGEYFTQFIAPDTDTKTLLIHRIDMTNTISGSQLVAQLEKGAQKTLPYYDLFTADNGWLNVWGTHTIKDGALTMSADADQSGAATLLDGSQSWKNYSVEVTATSPQQTGVFLWTRFADVNNNAGCNFGTNFIHIEEMVNGRSHVIKGIELPNVIPAGQFTFGATVNGRSMSCSINGQVVSTDFLDPSLTRGGTGIKIWDQILGKSAIDVTQFAVTPVNVK